MQINYEQLEKTEANHVALSPISFLNRAETLHSDRTAVVYGDLRRSERGRLASDLCFGKVCGEPKDILRNGVPPSSDHGW